MGRTDDFRAKHQELLSIASQISDQLDASKLAEDAKQARSLLSTLAGKLGMHLAVEDRNLYPELLNHDDENIRATAKRFIDEMGGIADAFKTYVNKWPHSKTIQDNPGDFITETKGIFNALAARISKEDNELYSMVDKL
ncbi:MAG: hemerythrin domain-containing protein [Proteobacteria bacterium]|nr:hemerythrin domain-containing protein [Pseudomonadota bacterium]